MRFKSGVLSLVKQQLRASLADSPACRALLGVHSSTAAKARIHLREIPKPAADAYTLAELEILRPYALIFHGYTDGESETRVADGVGTGTQWRVVGKLTFRLSRAVPDGMTDDEADTEWDDAVDAVMDDLWELSGDVAGGEEYLAVAAMKILQGPGRHHPDNDSAQGVEQGVDIEITWGELG